MNKPGILLAALALAGCATGQQNMPLVFGEAITFGVGIGTSAGEQGVDLTLGFKSRDIAIVPVTYIDGGNTRKLEAKITETKGKNAGATTEDAYSVLGQFSSNTDGASRKVGLGKFFATGAAAQVLAQGFADEMAGNGKPAEPKAADPKPAAEAKRN